MTGSGLASSETTRGGVSGVGRSQAREWPNTSQPGDARSECPDRRALNPAAVIPGGGPVPGTMVCRRGEPTAR